MAIKLIYGRAGCGKTHYITDKIRKRLASGQKSVLVVPEQYTHIAEHKLLSAIGSISADTAEVTSFNKMIKRVEREQGITGILSPMAKSIIMADVVSYTKLDYFSDSAQSSGFSDVCLKLVSEFKKYCITPEQLAESNNTNSNERLKLKINDIARIYSEYIRRIAEKGFDADDGASILAERIADNWDISETTFFFDEFTSFIPQEMQIIKELALKCQDIYITLCTDGRDDVLFAPITDTVNKINRMCNESGIEFSQPHILNENYKHGREIAFLEKNLFPYPKGKYDDDCVDINIFSASGPYAEVEDTARKIVHLCRDNGFRYRDIGVICSDMSTYAPYIKSVFSKHGISYFIDDKTPAINHRIIVFVLNVLDIYLNDYNNTSVFAFLKSGFCDVDADSVYLLENYCRSTNMHKNTWLNDSKWIALMDRFELSDYDKKRISDVRDNVVKPLALFHESIKGRHSAEHMCKALYEYLVEIGLIRHIEKCLKRFEKEQDVQHGEEYEKIWNIIVDALDSIAEVVGDKTVNVRNFRELLRTAFSGHSIGFIPKSLDDVFVGDVTRSKADNIRALFVLGVNDGVFPAPAPKGELINDKDKLILAESGIELSTDSKTKAFFERFFMYSAFTVPKEMLFVSFSRADNSSGALRPSFVLSDFKRIFPDLVTESDILEDTSDFGQMDYITAQTPTLEKMIEKMTEYKNGAEISPVWFDVYDYFCRNFDFGTKLKKYYAHTNTAFPIDRELMSKFIPDEFYTTVSRLQRYRSCRFSYFLEFVLKLKENSPFDITAIDTGSFVHGVIEHLCGDMAKDGYDYSTVTDEYIYGRIDWFIDDFIKKLTDNSAYISKRKLYLIKRLRNTIFRCFSLLKSHINDSKFEPLGYEMRFDDENIGCIEFDLGDGKKAKITGVIDRSDIYHGQDGDYIRVVDYKTGNKVFNLTDVFYGLDIQLFVYLNALVASKDNYKYGGALYFRIDDPMFKADNHYDESKTESKILSELKMKGLLLDEDHFLDANDSATSSAAKKATYDNFVDLDKHLRRIVSDLCKEMAEGRIDIRPYNKQDFSPCQYCGYKSVCRFDPQKRGNSYDNLSKMKDDEIWEAIGGKQNVD